MKDNITPNSPLDTSIDFGFFPESVWQMEWEALVERKERERSASRARAAAIIEEMSWEWDGH